uniref:Si:dkeyp-50b9.1 n=1 Tax=Cyprinus carpio carpio TaxID=630221 RepID=A0A8C1DEX7_CYPCA
MEGCMVRLHSVHFRGAFSAQPIIVNFHELFQTRDAPTILPMVKNEDVLRAVVALFDTSLPEIGPRDVHETVHYPGIHTIILSQDHADVLEDYRGRASQKGTNLSPVPCKTKVEADSTHKLLTELYSDSEESTEETSEEIIATETSISWSWERFCEGLQEFVDGARDRKEKRAVQREDGKIPPSAVGVESLIMAAACYELKILSTGDMVLQLSLLAVRKRYRHLGIGSYIMELLKTQSIVGKYDTLVAHADTDAKGFFKFHGLTDDPLLNDQFKELKDDWTNSILMSYLPPFTTDLEMRNPVFSLSLREVEMDMDVARSQALFAYQQQVMCVTRLLEEVKILRKQLDLRREEVDRLNSKLEQEKRKRHDIENKFLMYRLKNTKELLDNIASDSGEYFYCFFDLAAASNTYPPVLADSNSCSEMLMCLYNGYS